MDKLIVIETYGGYEYWWDNEVCGCTFVIPLCAAPGDGVRVELRGVPFIPRGESGSTVAVYCARYHARLEDWLHANWREISETRPYKPKDSTAKKELRDLAWQLSWLVEKL